MGAAVFSQDYTYNAVDGSINTVTMPDQQTLTMGYDSLRRLSTVTGGVTAKRYLYRTFEDNTTTDQVTSLSYTGLSKVFQYSYDIRGNIAAYTAPGKATVTYTYDKQGQLLSASNGYSYTYDNVGNILTATKNGTTHTYTYSTYDWKDKLISYDGQAIAYDASGNPTSYYNGTRWTFGWENGRELSTATSGNTNLSFAYDGEGVRTSKTVNGVEHKYYYSGGKLLRETYGSNILDFAYNPDGTLYSLRVNGTYYYYVTNLQGDVIAIVDKDKNVVASYEYDPYGGIAEKSGTLSDINPMRYRGYYYDTDTGLYYLQSRYYDPELGRFINADAFTSTGQGILGNNMFAYCNNNPVNLVDHTGAIGTLATVCGVSAVVSGLANAVSTACTGASLKECLIAGLCGAVGGAVGAFIGAVTPIDPLRAAVLGRGVTTVITDFATSYALNGKITSEDIIWTAVDTTMDICFSTIGYFYNPISDALVHATVDAVADGTFDVVQTYLFTNDSNVANSNAIMPHAGNDGLTRYRIQRKVGELLGIV